MNGQTRSSASRTSARQSGTLRIRRACAGDAAALAGFNCAMARETEGRDLSAATVRAGVDAVLREPARGFYLVAEIDGALAAALLVTFEWSDWRNAAFWWIQSVYVVPASRRRGLYRALHEHVFEQARTQGACGLRLYVEKDNHAAQNVYRSMGMQPTAYRLYEQEFDRR